MRADDGLRNCFHPAIAAITRNGAPLSAPMILNCSGSSANATPAIAAAIPALIHHDERIRIANSEFSAISHFMRDLS